MNRISINLHKINYNNSINKENKDDLLNNYYSIDNFRFSTYNITDNDLKNKFNVDNIKNINQNTNNLINLLKFDYGVLYDSDYLYNKIYQILEEYNNVLLYKLYDDYLLYYSDRAKKNNNINKDELFNNLDNLFISDLQNSCGYQKFKNIDKLLNNQIKDKLKDDLSYLDKVRDTIYESFYKNMHIKFSQDILDYEKELRELKELKQEVEFNLDFSNKKISNDYPVILEKLKTINDYVNSLSSNNSTNINGIKVNDLLNYHKLTNIYELTISNYKMNHILDDRINLVHKNTNNTLDQFLSSNITFLNELIKRKIKTVIRDYNYNSNKVNINNNIYIK
jgi:flagellar biosynthesis chaperone FliJ